ncbi:bifunctional diguanylate cyclase/phosphodiesterase [uncultured Piscinibacter sp.]|uniref:putative bifunctional diguanylate cyclase/phosphodiesterase n=1 Tax=uncultured Piscinibacter sp. TaxID=1131835 RepID=UPI00262D029B|nr:bifunctional diguanylate cyclase/phosphodiesterase [uncultured Piscinibacter sp.]
MSPVYLFSVTVSLTFGVALLAAWRRDREQAFLRLVGLAFLLHAGLPPAFAALYRPEPWLRGAALMALVALALLSAGLLAVGVGYLARRPFDARQRKRGGLLLLAAAVVLPLLGPVPALAAVALLNLGVGAAAAVWLWRRGGAERLAGVLLVLLALNQFQFVLLGEAGGERASFVTAVLRMAVGLTLLHAAVRLSAEASRLARERFMRLTEHSHQGVAVLRGEQMLYANPAMLRIYGLSSLDEVRTLWREATMPEVERAAGRERHRQLIAGEIDQARWSGQRFRFDGSPIRLRFSAWRVDWDGQPAEQVVVSDETAQHDATAALLFQATHDELTGLPNRSALLARLRELCASGTGFALLLLDVDRFKLFNEAHGHSVGDDVLRALAARLSETLRGQAEAMRLGEDEFALLAPADDAERRAHTVAQRVRELLALPVAVPGHDFYLDASMGVALHPAHGRGAEALLRAANAAMHEAKHTPGTSLQFAEERFERGSGATLVAEQALRAGLRNEEFSLVYQPKVEVRSALRAPRLVGFEALVRWDRPDIGRIAPLQFVPAAERTGTIRALGKLILGLACAQIERWRSEVGHSVPVAVNVSPLQLFDPGFSDDVLQLLSRHAVPPSLLSLEITESVAVTHMEEARGRIAQLRAHGIEVALDDFGTGFSSLNMLRSLPLRTVKIDRTLVEPLPVSDATAVVKAICDLAAALDLDVIAEGVETPAQSEALRAAGCSVMQGYLYARPLAPAEAARWLERAAPLPGQPEAVRP